MSGDRTGGFFRRGAEGRDVSGDRAGGFFGRGGKGRDADQTADDLEQDTYADRTATDSAQGPEDRDTAHGFGATSGEPAGEQEHPSGERTGAGAHEATPGGSRAKDAAGEGDPDDGLAEFAAELKLLAEAVLERVEPVLRQAADGQVEWSSCSWCPVCAAAALMRGQHHEVLRAVADHGTALVTVLREALAGVPVDPVMPEPDAHQHNHGVPQDHSAGAAKGAESTAGQHTSRAGKRSRYVGIPVTIKA